MIRLDQQQLREIEADLARLAQLEFLGTARQAWLDRVDMLIPPELVSTNQWADEKRYIKGNDELPTKYDRDKTPYTPGIQDACDMETTRVCAVRGNARSGKTISAENHALKRWEHGPWGDMFWYMQSETDVDDYMEERGEWNLENHSGIADRVDTGYKRQARDRKRIGESLALWMPATKKTTRGKGAPFIVADEIDAYPKRLLTGLLTLLLNRQREYGNAALLFLASHPDAGPTHGIEDIISQGTRHLWWWLCPHPACREHRSSRVGRPSSPSPEATIRMGWNVPELIKAADGIEKTDLLDYVEAEAHLVCPHCGLPIDNDMRLEMSLKTGAWLQPGQALIGPRKVKGLFSPNKIMGFCIQSAMSPFVGVGEAAREWTAAYLKYVNTHDDDDLKEVTVKTLGEVYIGANPDEVTEDAQTVQRRMQSGSSYLKGTVSRGVQFLTAFVDIQKDRFSVRVIGWNVDMESWLVDAYEIKQVKRDGKNMEDIDPFHRLTDWAVLEDAVIKQTYPIQGAPAWHMPIAKVAIDIQGGDQTTNNARIWSSNLIHRKEDPVPEWRILLHRGSKYKTGELYGHAKQVTEDDRGVKLPGAIWERDPRVHQVKSIIAVRQKIPMPGPGFMHAPQDLQEKYFMEMTSERKIAGDWIKHRANETWDAYVACETARASLQPQRPELDFENRPPIWAKPFRLGIDDGIDAKPLSAVSPYRRMLEANRALRDDDGQVQ